MNRLLAVLLLAALPLAAQTTVGDPTLFPINVAEMANEDFGDFSCDGAGSCTVDADAVALGTDTTNAYVATVAVGAGLSVSGVGAETATATLAFEYGYTLAGDPTFLANQMAFSSGAGACLISEGSTANTNEQLYCVPASDAADTTNYFALAASDGDALAGDSATSFFDTGTIEAARLPTTLQTDQFCYSLFDTTTAIPSTADIPSVWQNLARAITITEVRCEADAGSPTVNLQKDDGTPANILSSNITCGTTPTAGTIDTNEDNIAIGDEIDHVTVSGSTAKRINVCVEYTVD